MRVSQEVMAVLDRATADGQVLRLPGGQLDRKLYVSVNKVLELAGGKWTKKAGGHVFDGPAEDAMEQVLLTGQVLDKRQVLGFFETPAPVVDRLLEIADISRSDVVLEPSAGRGAIAARIDPLVLEQHCVEIDAAHTDTLRGAAPNAWISAAQDFLTWQVRPTFDRIVMNPPFAKLADIKHVNHAVKFLRAGGRLVSVMSAGITFRQDKIVRDFRDFLAQAGGHIEELPAGSFRASGTDVNTCIVTIPNVVGQRS